MEKTKLLTIAVIGLLLLNLGTLLFLLLQKPGPPVHGGPPPHERPSAIIIRTLELDEQQQEQFMELRDAHREKADQLEEQRMHLQRQLFDLLRQPQPNQAAADTLAAQIAALQQQMVLHNFRHLGELRTILRPGQMDNYEELTEQMASFFGPPRPPRHHHPKHK